jgi:predicted Holliday junction resolvase-like endonuclease
MNEMTLIVVLFLTNLLLAYLLLDKLRKEKRAEGRDNQIREEAIKKSRQVLEGKFKEQLAPILPEFNYNPTDARFLGSPVDFVVFNGLSGDSPEEVVFLEVKTGKAQLTEREQRLKDIIDKKKVRYEVLRV